MSLSGWDMADLDKLALEYASKGKNHAKDAYTQFAIKNEWGNTDSWLEGREFFSKAWRKYRREFLDSMKRVKKEGY